MTKTRKTVSVKLTKTEIKTLMTAMLEYTMENKVANTHEADILTKLHNHLGKIGEDK